MFYANASADASGLGSVSNQQLDVGKSSVRSNAARSVGYSLFYIYDMFTYISG